VYDGRRKKREKMKPTESKSKAGELGYYISKTLEALLKEDMPKAEELYGKVKDLKKGLEPEEKGMFNSQIERLEKELKLFKKKAKESEIKEAASKASAVVTGIFIIALLYLFLEPAITGLYAAENSAALSFMPTFYLEIGQEFSFRVYPDDPGRENVVFSDDTRLFSISRDGLLRFTPTEDMKGVNYVAIIAKDGTGWYDVKIVKLVIGEVTELSVEPGTVGNLTDLEYERIAVENFANQTINEKSNLTNLTD